MLASDRQALQDLVLSFFAKADWYQLSTCDAQAVVDDILDTARTILSDACHRRNQLKSIFPLPPEILAGCFAFLPLQGRVTASHVSRTWRATALEFPSVWNDMTCASGEDGLSPALVKMALSRSGNLPIQLEYQRWLDGDIANLVETHLNRMAVLKLYSYTTLSFLNQPAPLLQTLVLMDDAPLSEEFLARTPGGLTSLHADSLSIPASCYGLSTLTTLSASISSRTTLHAIFAMCPCLQSLSLWYLTQEHVAALGRCPQTLSILSLATNHRDCDLIAVYEAYNDSKALQRITPECIMAGRDDDFGNSLHGAVDIDVSLLAGGTVSVAALFASGRRLTISWPLDDGYTATAQCVYPPIFAQAAPHFAQMRTVSLPLGMLPSFILDAPPLPVLKELLVDIAPGTNHLGHRNDFDWSDLAKLQDLSAPRVTLNVAAHPTGPSADDARALLACLSRYAAHLAVTVMGLSEAAVPEDIPPGLNVEFVQYPTGDLSGGLR